MDAKIEQWQSLVRDEGEASTSGRDGLASRLSNAALELYALILKHAGKTLSKPQIRRLQRDRGYFVLWCDGFELSSGNLDEILADSKWLRHSTYRSLVSICRSLAERLAAVTISALDDKSRVLLEASVAHAKEQIAVVTEIMQDEDGDDSDSDADSISGLGHDAIDDIIEDLKTDVRCLVDLGPRYGEPVRDTAAEEKAADPSQYSAWNPGVYLASRIRDRYPDGDDALIKVLGQTNWDRALRLYERKEQSKLESNQSPVEIDTTHRTVVASEFHDSGLGTSISTPNSYAQTVVSYAVANTNGSPIRIPEPPPAALAGNPFPCSLCGARCFFHRLTWKRGWKKHVMSDLQPYTCPIATCDCAVTPFPDIHELAEHLEVEHDIAVSSRDITCPLCVEQLGSNKIRHLAQHLEEISLIILPPNAELDEEPGGPDSQTADGPIGKSTNQPITESAGRSGHETKWECGICGDAFTRKSNYQAHIDLHYGERKHACETCGKRFRRVNDRNRHRRIHLPRLRGDIIRVEPSSITPEV
ncbi:hypothetical protein QBC47DRAFT_385416 [Echria macrotheca]|uniref:C2H2-type domain-containing protein n=1 Tax=Echria macrotheca TaxID=438768 RepID=A0AAJ0F849_9PEZI|nr:hypothetical protein QBC47DRAFT_385416 [Echria macrotheca]